MTDTLNSQQHTSPSQEPSLVRRPKGFLNSIMEENPEEGTRMPQSMHGGALEINSWLSPMIDHFPTPRGVHYLAAPVLPSSPSTISAHGSSPSRSSNPWNRVSIGTENTEFEDLYGVSDEDDDNKSPRLRRTSAVRRRRSQVVSSADRPPRVPIIADHCIDTAVWSTVDDIKNNTSPVHLAPAARLPISRAQVNFMGKQQALEVPAISAPPSLDGSFSSDQLSAMSAPSTPVDGNDERRAEEVWNGVRLQPDALATLQALCNSVRENAFDNSPRVLDLQHPPSDPTTASRQRLPRLTTSIQQQPPLGGPAAASPSPSLQSLAGLTLLDIPSPAGFFSGLSPATRNTWHMLTKTPDELSPPTSTTAEQFYRCPWNIDVSKPASPKRPESVGEYYRTARSSSHSGGPAEHVVRIRDDANMSDGTRTTRPMVQDKEVNLSVSLEIDDGPVEIVTDYDVKYARKLQTEALLNCGRTELWLMAQRTYLQRMNMDSNQEDGSSQKSAEESGVVPILEHQSLPEAETEELAASKRKAVRFSSIIPTIVKSNQATMHLVLQESAYFREFQNYMERTHARDVFIHQLTRFEALQARRVALREAHRNQLLGKFQLSVVPQSAKKRLSANVARGDLMVTDDPGRIRKEKEFEALGQMTVPAWHVAAVKFLNGGRLLTSPVAKRLDRFSCMTPGRDGVSRDRARILDLGGPSTCDWAWHCAFQYPSTKIYSVTTKAIRQLSNANIRGPSNHRQVAVERLTRLPFADDRFDVISARELHSILKLVGEKGEDEWESCLRECMRVLKPGGYLEFSILDADMVNAGPVGLAKSVEFAFSLKTLGYDPSPSRTWLGRLARAGFEDTRRIWMCLPMGAGRRAQTAAPPPASASSSKLAEPGSQPNEPDASLMGSSDNVAGMCSIVGGWSWERWLLRCELEKVAGKLRLADTVTPGAAMKEAGKCLEGVHAVMEEGRGRNAGFRMLNGYARKPKASGTDVARTALAG
ncbi:hypothetical protein DCS_07471 [Drechmeria coniospora]|uniref:Methyltransferase type 11 domain-containing protein n=1 Tax=Drechmeria coniospora TaxID=98403 RepID=A0A151GEJ5_DRECN|nr:hypothetical protein DCS_07471 [Drechmeria coniospora]KYK55508.1 hypothetical protein DCS_07471 [Drechmeria coniospora]